VPFGITKSSAKDENPPALDWFYVCFERFVSFGPLRGLSAAFAFSSAISLFSSALGTLNTWRKAALKRRISGFWGLFSKGKV
jgi:hypothetical protein